MTGADLVLAGGMVDSGAVPVVVARQHRRGEGAMVAVVGSA